MKDNPPAVLRVIRCGGGIWYGENKENFIVQVRRSTHTRKWGRADPGLTPYLYGGTALNLVTTLSLHYPVT